MLVFVPQKILSLSCNLHVLWLSVSCSSSLTSLPVHTNDSGLLALAIFIFFLLSLVSPSTVCLQHASLMRMFRVFFSVFGECQAPPIGLEYELQRFRSFSVDPCVCVFLKRWRGRRRKTRSFSPVWTRPKAVQSSLNCTVSFYQYQCIIQPLTVNLLKDDCCIAILNIWNVNFF